MVGRNGGGRNGGGLMLRWVLIGAGVAVLALVAYALGAKVAAAGAAAAAAAETLRRKKAAKGQAQILKTAALDQPALDNAADARAEAQAQRARATVRETPEVEGEEPLRSSLLNSRRGRR